LINSGVFYIYKRDRQYRPILILNVERLCIVNKARPFSVDELSATTSYMMQFITDKLLIPGICENWVLLIDMKNIGMTDVPIQKMKAMVSSG
jgi:hypothetical protein